MEDVSALKQLHLHTCLKLIQADVADFRIIVFLLVFRSFMRTILNRALRSLWPTLFFFETKRRNGINNLSNLFRLQNWHTIFIYFFFFIVLLNIFRVIVVVIVNLLSDIMSIERDVDSLRDRRSNIDLCA
jgi:hypothetical protein